MIFSDLAAITGDRHRSSRAAFYALTVCSTALQAAAALTLIPVLERLFGDHPADAWPWVALLIVEFVAASSAEVAATRAGVRVGFGLVDAAERSGVAAIRRLDPAALHGDDASQLREMVAKSGPESVSAVALLLSPLVHAALLVPLLALGLLFVAWQLALVALVGGVALLAAFAVGRAAVTRSEDAFAAGGRDLDDAMFEFGWAQPTLRAAGVGTATVDPVLAASRRHGMRLLAWQIPGDTLFTVVGQLVLIAFGVTTGALYLSDDLSGITAAAMIVVLLRVVETTGSLSLLATPIAALRRLLAELRELVEADQDEAATGAPADGARPMQVRLSGVGYEYPDGTRALHGVDLTIAPGEITVLVGASGSGKSTLLDILSGLREPTEGTVSDDGLPVDAQQRLDRSSVVFQTTTLRPGTLRENVLAGGADGRVDLAELSGLSRLDPVLETLAEGWESRVGDGANTLSGGERQRVGLARALARPAGLLLVDEATSALDVVAERAVVDSLRSIRGSRTVVAVTHRPALVAAADSVVVVDGGRIVDAGSVDDLLDRGGVFADLWRRWRESEGWQV